MSIRGVFGLTLLAALFTGCGDEDRMGRDPSAMMDSPPEVLLCVPLQQNLYAGQTIDAGDVTIENNNTTLKINVQTQDGWMLKALHIYVGTTPVPTNAGGNVAPGQFPYKTTYASPVSSATISIPISDLGVQCFGAVYIAVHAEVVKGSQSETAWAEGPFPFLGGQWGWSMNYQVCCQDTPDTGCTLTQGYWKNHNKYATNPSQNKPWPISEDTLLCGKTYLSILNLVPKGEAWIILAHQFIAAKLNAATGASTPQAVSDALSQAATLLANNCSQIPSSLKSTAISLAGLLDQYNNGDVGPGHCE